MASPSISTIPSRPGRTINLLRILPDNHNSGAGQTQPSTLFPGTRKYTFSLNPDPSGKLKGCPSYAVLSYTRPRPNLEPKSAQPTPIPATPPTIPEAITQALQHILTSRATHPRQPWFVWVDCLCPQSTSESDLEAVATRRAILQGAEVVYVCLEPETESGRVGAEHGVVDVSRVLRDEYWGRMDSVVEVMLARRVVVLQGGGRVRWKALEAGAVGELAGSWGGRMIQARRGLRSRGGGMSFSELWEAFEAWDVEVGVRERVLAFLVVSGEEVGDCCLERAGIEGFEDAQMEFDDDDEDSDDDDFDEEMTMADSYLALATRDHRFGTVLEHIMRELNSLEEECNRPVGSHGIFGGAMGNVDAEVARFQGLLRRMDHLERELDRVLEMWDIVRGCRGAVDEEMDGC